jgi:hypothetical protein
MSSRGGVVGIKPLYQFNRFGSLVTNLLQFVKNTTTFVDKVKIIFEQKGFIASGLKATIQVNKVPLSFSA